MDPILRKQSELQNIRDAKARWWKRLSRATTAINDLNEREKRLLRPRKLEPHESATSSKKLTGAEVHKIHGEDFNDTLVDL